MIQKHDIYFYISHALLSFYLLGQSENGLGSTESIPSNLPKAAFDLTVVDSEDGPNRLDGLVSWSNLSPDLSGSVCFYLPYNDPAWGTQHGAMSRFEQFSGRQLQPPLLNGEVGVSLQASDTKVTESDIAHLIKVRIPANWNPSDRLEMTLKAKIPRHHLSDKNDWFYDGFMPQLLPDCGNLNPQDFQFPPTSHVTFTGTLQTPSSWTYAGPGSVPSNGRVEISQVSTSLSFALKKNPRIKNINIGNIPIRLVGNSENFFNVASSVEEILPKLISKIGPPPFDSMTIVETAEVQRSSLYGIIALNRSAQPIFEKLQSNWINWRYWIIVHQLVKQWFGTSLTASSNDDDWLLEGITEYITLSILMDYPEKFDLFNLTSDSQKLLSLTYLQFTELLASMLHQSDPFAVLTNDQLTSKIPKQRQHPLLFIKHFFSLRQLADISGEDAFFAMLRRFHGANRYRNVNPSDFVSEIERKPSPFPPSLRLELLSSIKTWWTKEGWPDFTLTKFINEPLSDGKWLAKAEGVQNGDIDFPPLISFADEDGRSYFVRATPRKDTQPGWYADTVTLSRPRSAMIDPLHKIYDSNRFDNSSESPEILFFPGTTNTLRDDAYTILWAPYPFRRPGEPFSLGLASSIRHYLDRGTNLRLEYAPTTHRISYYLIHDTKWNAKAITAQFIASQNYFRDQRLELSLTRSPLFSLGPRLSIASKLRKKEEAGKSESVHFTYALAVTSRPAENRNICQPILSIEWEKAPPNWAKEFSYERKTASFLNACTFPRGFALKLRAFVGDLSAIGTPPLTSQFRPNDLTEVGLRLDRNSTRSNHIASLQTDLMSPFPLPFSRNFLFLPRQIKWRLFLDAGKSYDLDKLYHSAGTGLFLPFGGDITGAGALTLSRVSFLAILYQKIGTEITRKPGIVLDITGEL